MNEREERIERMETLLKAIPGEKQEEWRQALYQSYSRRLGTNVQAMWQVTSIIVPVSFGSFVALPAVFDNTIYLLLLSSFSVSLVLFWFLISARHISYQERSFDFLRAIERTIELRELETIFENYDSGFYRGISPTFSQWVRRGATALVLLAWTIVWLVHIACIFFSLMAEVL